MLQHNKSVPAARPSDLKLNNRRQILELFKFGTVRSVAEIAREVGVSRQTVMKSIQYFLEKGIITSDGKADSGSMGGKRAELFKLSPDRYLISMIVRSDVFSITLMNFRSQIVETRELKDTEGLEVDGLVEAASAACEGMLADHGIDVENVRGLCITVSGIVGGDGNCRQSAFFPGWGKRLNIVEAFRKRLGEHILVIGEDIGEVCGSALLHSLGSVNERVAAILTFRDDISLCLIAHGDIVMGTHSYPSEFGHMIVASDDSEVCVCGSRGCLERQISAARLRRLRWEKAKDFPKSPLEDDLTIQDVFDASSKGDALAGWLSAYVARHFAHALRNLSLTFNPDRVVFQGEYAQADATFREALYEELMAFKCFRQDDVPEPPFKPEVDARSLYELSTLGAYSLLIDRLFAKEVNLY